MEKKNLTVFDKTKVYDTQIRELAEQLRNKCTTMGIPFFFAACVKNTEEGSVYEQEAYPCGSGGIRLTDDRITPHLNVALGFRTIPKNQKLEIIFEQDELPELPEDGQ